MPRNLKGGKHKHIRKGNRYQKDESLQLASDIPGSLYAIITKKHGNGFDVLCSNGKTEFAIIRGKFRGKVWMNINDVVLVDGSELNMYIIVKKYTADEIRKLKAKGEITFDIKGGNSEDNIVFDDNQNLSDNDTADNDNDDEFFKEFDNKNNIKIIENLDKKPAQQPNQQPDQKPDQKQDQQPDQQPDQKTNEENNEGDDDDDEEDDDEQEKDEPNNSELNKNKLLDKYKNKIRGGKGIVRERNRATARDKKGRHIDFGSL